MKFHCLVLLALAASSQSKPLAKSYAESFGYTYNPVVNSVPFTGPSSQFHTQDELGGYNYGYSGDTSTKQEIRTPDGVTRGAYSYVDANGKIQRVDYISDVLGFRTVATNLPQGVAPAVSAVPYAQATVKAVPVQQVVQKPSVIVPSVAYSYLPYATNYGYFYTPGVQQVQAAVEVPVEEDAVPEAEAQVYQAAVPPVLQAQVPVVAAPAVQVAAEPVPAAIPVVPAAPAVTQTSYHAQDEQGQYQFGYSDPNSARTETKTADGVVQGQYNYVDDQGKIQTVQYIADGLGFRVAGTNLPVATYRAVDPVEDTPEVIAARIEHQKLFAEITARDQELREIAAMAAKEAAEAVEVQEDKLEVPAIPLAQVKKAPVQVPAVPEVVAAEVPVQVPVVQAQVPVVQGQVPTVQAQVPVAVPVVAVQPVASNQYHIQDEFGQYNFGYANADSAKIEQKTADGTVQGSYRYVDADGKLQTVNYISDALGFRVAATNLPIHNVAEDVAAADPVPAEAAPVVAPVQTAPQTVITPQVAYSYLPYASQYQYLLPGRLIATNTIPVAVEVPKPETEEAAVEPAVVVAAAPQPAVAAAVVQPAVAVPAVTSSQYHAQDESGQYSYGYSSNLSTKQESKTADGTVTGSYTYVDAHGLLQTVNYISDALGFRAAGTNIPSADKPMLSPKVAYGYLPYATQHPYYY